MNDLLNDIRYSVRTMLRSPAVTAVAILTLALGIGANTAIFSVINSVLLKPLPYRQPASLVTVFSQFPTLDLDHFWLSPPEYLELRAQARSFEDMAAYSLSKVNVTGREVPLRADAVSSTASLLTTLGVGAQLGRFYSPEEDLPNAEPVVLLGNSLWRRGFGRDPAIIGKRIGVDGVQRTVVGVMPPGFQIEGQQVDLVIPLALGPVTADDRGNHYLTVIARLRQGTSVEAARGEIAGMLARWPQERPDTHTPKAGTHPLVIRSLHEDLVGQARPALQLLWGAVGFVLLIACANVANLLLAQAEARHREIAIRTALGADRRRLLRQFLTESILLSILGGLLGVVFAVWGIKIILGGNPTSIPRFTEISLDLTSFLFTLLISLLTGLIFGLAPALHARTGAFFLALKEGGQRATATGARQRLRNGLVIAEVALAAALVVGGGLLIRSFWTLQQVDPGFRAEGVLALQVSLPEATYPEPAQIASFYQRLTDRLRTLPGVEGVAAMTGLPPKREINATNFEIEGFAADPDSPPPTVDYWQFATQDYFGTMVIPLVAGRSFTAADSAESPKVVVINETMAKTYWPDRNPIGQRLRQESEEPWFTVVGIAKDVKQDGLDQKTGTEVYYLAQQVPYRLKFVARTVNVVLRTSADPLGLVNPVRNEIARLDPSLPVDNVRRLEDVVESSTARSSFVTLLVLVLALVALSLATVGTYSVLAYNVAQRRQEIGVRMALGAQVRNVLGLVVGKGMRMVAAGIALGLILSFVLGRWLSSLLFGVEPTDPMTFISVALLLTGVSLLACYLPARRAAHVDPIMVLRGQ